MITAIGAVSSNGMIGLDGWLPWDIPEELAFFEKTVAGAALVIGRLTYESMDVVPPDSFIVTSQAGLVLKPGWQRNFFSVKISGRCHRDGCLSLLG